MAQYLYDAVYLYMKIADKLASIGADFLDGSLVLKYAKGMNFTGQSSVSLLIRCVFFTPAAS
jgi:hypothetical protein